MDTPTPLVVGHEAQLPADATADGVDRALDPRHVHVERIGGLAFAAVAAIASLFGLTLLWATGDLPVWLTRLLFATWPVGVGGLAWLMYRWPAVAYRHASYRIDDRGITIRGGVFWRVVVHVPRSRVQHTDVAQGPLERRFGLGTLVIYTAGTDHARVALPGLDHETAVRIRDRLLPPENSDAV